MDIRQRKYSGGKVSAYTFDGIPELMGEVLQLAVLVQKFRWFGWKLVNTTKNMGYRK